LSLSADRKKRMLIVDDEPDITSALSATLEDTFEVHAFNDPLKVVASFKPGLYDIALVDYKMPQLSGLEMLKIISKIDAKVKVVIMTAFDAGFLTKEHRDQPGNIETLLAKGCIIRKPFSKGDLLAKLDIALKSEHTVAAYR